MNVPDWTLAGPPCRGRGPGWGRHRGPPWGGHVLPLSTVHARPHYEHAGAPSERLPECSSSHLRAERVFPLREDRRQPAHRAPSVPSLWSATEGHESRAPLGTAGGFPGPQHLQVSFQFPRQLSLTTLWGRAQRPPPPGSPRRHSLANHHHPRRCPTAGSIPPPRRVAKAPAVSPQ